MLAKHHLINSDAMRSKKHFSDIREFYELLLCKREREGEMYIQCRGLNPELWFILHSILTLAKF